MAYPGIDNSPIKRVVLVGADGQPNYNVGLSNESNLVTKTVTFDGSSGNGAAGTVNLFTVTGDCVAQVFAICSADLTTNGAATITLGLVGNTTAWIAATTATDIDSGESWTDNVPAIGEALTALRIIPRGADITSTIATADITGGTLIYYCLWRPLSTDGNIVAV